MENEYYNGYLPEIKVLARMPLKWRGNIEMKKLEGESENDYIERMTHLSQRRNQAIKNVNQAQHLAAKLIFDVAKQPAYFVPVVGNAVLAGDVAGQVLNKDYIGAATTLGTIGALKYGTPYLINGAKKLVGNTVNTTKNVPMKQYDKPMMKTRLRLPSHTKQNPREFVLDHEGDNKFRVHMKTWDGDRVPANLTEQEKQTLFNATYEELPEGAEILFPKSGEGYYATRGTVAGLQRLARDSRFTPGTRGTLYYLDKDEKTIRTYKGTSFIKAPRITSENAANITPKQWTAAQDAAIARGDMAEAQRLRDLHFKVSAPNSVSYDVFHHGNQKPMNWFTFDPARVGTTDEGYSGAGYYFAPTRPASQYSKEHFAHTLGPHGEQNAGLSGGKYHRYVYLNGKTKYEPIREYDWTTHTDFPFVDNRPTEVVVGDNRQIKLADAVTYDDNGVRIPLGKRDNFNINDIRYAMFPFVGGGAVYGVHKTNKGEL